MQEYINDLPQTDSSDIFGMHHNAEKVLMESEAVKFVDLIIQVQPKLTTSAVLE